MPPNKKNQAKFYNECFKIVQSIDDEFRHNLSLHLYSSYLLRQNNYGIFPRRGWAHWPVKFDEIIDPKTTEKYIDEEDIFQRVPPGDGTENKQLQNGNGLSTYGKKRPEPQNGSRDIDTCPKKKQKLSEEPGLENLSPSSLSRESTPSSIIKHESEISDSGREDDFEHIVDSSQKQNSVTFESHNRHSRFKLPETHENLNGGVTKNQYKGEEEQDDIEETEQLTSPTGGLKLEINSLFQRQIYAKVQKYINQLPEQQRKRTSSRIDPPVTMDKHLQSAVVNKLDSLVQSLIVSQIRQNPGVTKNNKKRTAAQRRELSWVDVLLLEPNEKVFDKCKQLFINAAKQHMGPQYQCFDRKSEENPIQSDDEQNIDRENDSDEENKDIQGSNNGKENILRANDGDVENGAGGAFLKAVKRKYLTTKLPALRTKARLLNKEIKEAHKKPNTGASENKNGDIAHRSQENRNAFSGNKTRAWKSDYLTLLSDSDIEDVYKIDLS